MSSSDVETLPPGPPRWRQKLKGVLIVLLVLALSFILQQGVRIALATPNPFYVVVSKSMEPELRGGSFWEFPDVVMVVGAEHVPFPSLQIGDTIVFNRPTNRPPIQGDPVIVHKVWAVQSQCIRTKGVNNPSPDHWCVSDFHYLGKVVYVFRHLGFFTLQYEEGRRSLLPYPYNLVLAALLALLYIWGRR